MTRGPSRRWGAGVLGALVLGALLFAISGWWVSERRAIHSMEPAAREALFQQSWKGFEQLCLKDPSDAFLDRCHDQARFLLLFPECQGACLEQARLRTRALR
ncbi:hypothetical protein [Pyxidicoccus sp. MSG2]|uniref:hypothetical protein n=1 Tax=Pyxidicoccus sp. MSG2 TaxID=2996790 RepID=UPI00226F55A3|nr:hypothetical protein [Pyxidicoccus sp. MSG2]MCY1017973.1 hypothetical protein [Pyxidicoccus sp. MSG2]